MALVGGATRMPSVQAFVSLGSQAFPLKVCCTVKTCSSHMTLS